MQKRDETKRKFLDLMLNPEGVSRRKALRTLMKRKKMSFWEAKEYQARKITGYK